MFLKSALLLLLLATVSPPAVAANFEAYWATIVEIPGTNSGVTGMAVVFVSDDDTTVGYAGYGAGLQPNLMSSTCNATNGCGAHIHSGLSCESSEAQEGHYFADPITEDPWLEERYDSDANGDATYAGVIKMGTTDVEGRAFLLHAEDGSRLGCGLLEKVPPSSAVYDAVLDPLENSGVQGSVSLLRAPADSDRICFFGMATGLESNLLSFQEESGQDCTDTNGCGAHVHAGKSCADSTAQMGHYYNETLSSDPWAIVGYLSTDSAGQGYFADCVSTGVTDFDRRAFIVHYNDGSRVSCGLMEAGTDPSTSAAAVTGKDASVLTAGLLLLLSAVVVPYDTM